MPDRDGFSLLVELRRNHPGVSVVVMSAQQDQESVVRALNMGALGFIPKSAQRKVLLSALQLVMSGGVYIPTQALSPAQPQAPSAQPTTAPAPAAPAVLPPQGGAAAPSDLGLTGRQVDVLTLIMQGKSNKAICRVLDLAEPTVKNHVTGILKALNVTNRTEAVIKVGELGWELPEIGG